ncbi:MAG: phosphatidylethanolamine-binding protein, partial [Schlesneria sp.]
MFPRKSSLIALSIFFSATSLLFAHPGHSPRKPGGNTSGRSGSSGRTWTDTTGRLLRHGSFVAVTSGDVQIRQTDESLVRLKLSQLSESDQQWVAQRLEQIRETNKAVEQLSQFIGSSFMQTDELEEREEVEDLATNRFPLLLAEVDQKDLRKTAEKVPEMAKAFEAFVRLKAIKTRWDNQYFYVESNGIPAHPMMIGITAWQQQVPIPQKYIGENAWQIPLRPVPAKNPQTAKGNFLRGAIAVAANGIPIFNPLNNRGDDAYLFGELDEFGGHCGRADDYH